MEWKFVDPPNAAVIADSSVVEGRDWIAYVYHDADDGAWQFRAARAAGSGDAMLISLRRATQIDPTVIELVDLPPGWHAWRETRYAAWQREAPPSAPST